MIIHVGQIQMSLLDYIEMFELSNLHSFAEKKWVAFTNFNCIKLCYIFISWLSITTKPNLVNKCRDPTHSMPTSLEVFNFNYHIEKWKKTIEFLGVYIEIFFIFVLPEARSIQEWPAAVRPKWSSSFLLAVWRFQHFKRHTWLYWKSVIC